VAVAAFYLAAWRVWTYDPDAARPPGKVDVAEARFYGDLLN
jgi:hypothetical protein